MEANSTDKKTFQLTENGQALGELGYKNLFSLKAEIKLPNAEYYEIAPVGFWATSIAVTRNGVKVAGLAMNWSGQIVIAFQDGQEFVLKLNGFFQSRYVVENKNQEKLIQLEPRFNWSAFQYNYSIACNMANDNNPKNALLLLLSVYAANYFIAVMSGGSAGMG